MKKDWLVEITVNNAGLDFDDDVSLVLVTVDAELTRAEVLKKIAAIDKKLRKEDKSGECLYNEYGWNAGVLLDEACEKYGWSWEYLNPDIAFTI